MTATIAWQQKFQVTMVCEREGCFLKKKISITLPRSFEVLQSKSRKDTIEKEINMQVFTLKAANEKCFLYSLEQLFPERALILDLPLNG